MLAERRKCGSSIDVGIIQKAVEVSKLSRTESVMGQHSKFKSSR